LLEERNAAGSLLGLTGLGLFGPDLPGFDTRPQGEATQPASSQLATPFDQQDLAKSAPIGLSPDQQTTTLQREQSPAPPATTPAPASQTGPAFGAQPPSDPTGSASLAALLDQALSSPAQGGASSGTVSGNTAAAAAPQGQPASGAAPVGVPAGRGSMAAASLPPLQGAPRGAVAPSSGTTGGGTSGSGSPAAPTGGGGGGGVADPSGFNWQFTAYESLSGDETKMLPPRPSVLNVAGDAGLLSTAIPEVPGDSLVASLPSGAETEQTDHGTVIVGGDGSFSYRANDDYVGTDSFSFTVTDTMTGNSSSGTVQINVIPQTRGYLTPADVQLESGADLWPKMHHDTLDTGDAPWFQRVQDRVTDTIAFGSPGIRTLGATTLSPGPVPTVYTGSPVIGIGPGSSSPAYFVESDSQVYDPNHGLKGVNGGVMWTNPSFIRPNVPYQTVYRAPLLAMSQSNPYQTIVVLGNQEGKLLFVNGNNGTTASSFTPYDDGTGVIAGSPTLGWALNSANGPPVDGAPSYFDMPDSATFIFGTDFQQHDWSGNPGPSLGREYAVRDDATVAWMTLTAGVIHGCPSITPSNQYILGNRSYVYTGTGPNAGTGDPTTDLGRFYKLDLMTGKVVAGLTTDGQAIVQSSTAIPGMTNGQVDYESPDTRLFVTSTEDPTHTHGFVMAYDPTLQLAWEDFVPIYPTSPALSIDPIDTRMIYLGNSQDVRALSADTGNLLWLDPGTETGSVSVAWDDLRTPRTGQLQWEVVRGDLTNYVVKGLDGRLGYVIDQSAAYPGVSFTSAPAIGWPQVGQAGLQASIWMTSNDGTLWWMG
jgi:hypothetical protein